MLKQTSCFHSASDAMARGVKAPVVITESRRLTGSRQTLAAAGSASHPKGHQTTES